MLSSLEQNSLTLDEGTLALGQLECMYREADQQCNIQKSQRIKMLIDQLKPIVDEMNQSANFVTTRDLQMIASFFSPPLEQFYTDPGTSQTYRLADNSHLAKLALTAWTSTTCYSGIEVSKLYKVRDCSKIQAYSQEGNFSNLCDIIFFHKLKQLIASLAAIKDVYLSVKNFFTRESRPRNLDRNQAILEQQREVLSRAHQHLQTVYGSWGYIGFCTLQTETQLLSLGLPADNVKEYQAICLFLNPINRDE